MPISGKRILVTQAEGQASELIDKLEELGAEVIHRPMITIQTLEEYEDLDKSLLEDTPLDWIIFSSINSVDAFARRIMELNIDHAKFEKTRFATVGDTTANAVRATGFQIDLTPEHQTSAGLIEEFEKRYSDLTGSRILFPAGNIARDTIPKGLRALGADVVRITAYNTVAVEYRADDITELIENKLDLLTFTSSSTVDNLIGVLPESDLERLKPDIHAASIGNTTSKTLQGYGIEPVIESEKQSAKELVIAIKNYYESSDSG